MSVQSAGVTVLNRTIATVLFSTVTGCLGSTGRFQLNQVDLKSDSTLKSQFEFDESQPSLHVLYAQSLPDPILVKLMRIIFEFLR